MKLYANVTSERASKGQGGNKQLEITLLIDPVERKEVGRLVMTHDNGVYEISYYPINSNCEEQKLNQGRVTLYKTQKKKCAECVIFHNGYCDICQMKKGEKQKGEILEDYPDYETLLEFYLDNHPQND